MSIDPDAMPDVGEPGTAAAFQLRRLREWGLGDLADACTTREQALLAHHCALYVLNVWRDLHGEGAEPNQAAVRHCVGELMQRPSMVERAHRAAEAGAEHDDWAPDPKSDEELYAQVKAALSQFG